MKKTRGRPKVGSKPIHVRFPPAELKRLDAWILRQPDAHRVTRPEAVRRIVAAAANAALAAAKGE